MTNNKPHGTLVNANSGVRIPGTLIQEGFDALDFQIDGTTELGANYFQFHDGWSFEPDAQPLPTEPGFYRLSNDLDWAGAFQLDCYGEWHRISGFGDKSDLSVEDLKTAFPGIADGVSLVRLVPEV